MERSLLRPVIAGMVTAIVGFAGTFTVVLAGLRAVGADSRQAASGLLAICVAAGVVTVLLSVRHRLPVTAAWSTPGAALLLSTGPVDGGYPAAVGAFLVCGLAMMAVGLFPALGRLIALIPQPIAGAMLAGILLKLCLAPVSAVAQVPWMALPVIVIWAVLYRYARLWSVPGALAAAVLAILWTTPSLSVSPAPGVAFTWPVFTGSALVSIALPLFLVTMASQNVPGLAVLSGYGYRPPFTRILLATGAGSAAGAVLGGHAVNLAAITAALTAGPDADPDPARRWIASTASGLTMIVLGLGAGLATALVLLAPPVLIEAVAGLALFGALASSIAASFGEKVETAAITFVVTASGVSFFGIGSAFWGLLAGVAFHLLTRRHPAGLRSTPASESA
ncbi:benzoate/H(+) symporter BenE family transporter [Nonomuraea typhae]|uniref:benzoate/H(+) symporter BenE family transporter n=1 Tax=Nonomuraea typhae TaxID=2603600 RepID=UPI001FE543CE|nr:benzoate/H(+) symporter BenE family transporter [Nonomuraea typhae]